MHKYISLANQPSTFPHNLDQNLYTISIRKTCLSILLDLILSPCKYRRMFFSMMIRLITLTTHLLLARLFLTHPYTHPIQPSTFPHTLTKIFLPFQQENVFVISPGQSPWKLKLNLKPVSQQIKWLTWYFISHPRDFIRKWGWAANLVMWPTARAEVTWLDDSIVYWRQSVAALVLVIALELCMFFYVLFCNQAHYNLLF